MKIQDIFNLPKNRGGAKLFNRIMNRYGIPKEDSKELKNNIDNSSSGGGSNDIEYYYKSVNMTDDAKALIKYLAGTFPIIKIKHPAIGIVDRVVGNSVDYGDIITQEGIAFSIPNGEYILFYSQREPDNSTFEVKCNYPKGDLFNKMLENNILPEESIKEVVDFLKQVFIPITEEEFYNLN